jgi:hypothetical protein
MKLFLIPIALVALAAPAYAGFAESPEEGNQSSNAIQHGVNGGFTPMYQPAPPRAYYVTPKKKVIKRKRSRTQY